LLVHAMPNEACCDHFPSHFDSRMSQLMNNIESTTSPSRRYNGSWSPCGSVTPHRHIGARSARTKLVMAVRYAWTEGSACCALVMPRRSRVGRPADLQT
jgi:hypothetical protein